MGMLVGILSLLVTILIGWQIYNVLQVEKKIHDVLGNAIGETTKKMLIKTEESKEEAIGTSLFNLGQAMFYNGFYIHALDNFIKALESHPVKEYYYRKHARKAIDRRW